MISRDRLLACVALRAVVALLALVAATAVAPPAARAQEPAQTGSIEIGTDPDVDVFLDGAAKGKTTKAGSFKLDGVAPGRHTVRIVKPGHEPIDVEVAVEAGRTERPYVGSFRALPGQVRVACAPGVEVFLDGSSKGRTTAEQGGLAIERVEPGRHAVKLEKPGYKTQEIGVEVPPGGSVAPPVAALEPDVKVSESDEEPSYSLRDKTSWVIVKSLPVEAAVSSATLGLAAAKKSGERLTLLQVPEGRHRLVVEAGGKRVEHEIAATPGSKHVLMVYVDEGRVTENLGEVRVQCEAGAELFVDGARRGVAGPEAASGGHVVRDVEPGRRKLGVKVFGYRLVEAEVTVDAGKTVEHRVASYDLKPEALVFDGGGDPPPGAREKMWRLVVTSVPAECTVDCYDLELKKAPKTKDRWVAYGVVGRRMSFTFATADGSGTVYQDVDLKAGKTTSVKVYFADRRAAVDKGDIVVRTAAPGVAISIDGTERGTTAAAPGEEGASVRVADLAAGKHVVRATMDHFLPQEAEATVDAGEVATVLVPRLKPNLKVMEGGAEPADEPADLLALREALGTIVVASAPPECAIACAGLGLDGLKKTKERLTVYGVPEGRYELAFSAGGKTLAFAVEARAARRARVFVDFGAGKVEPLPPTPEDFVLAADLEGHASYVASIAMSPKGDLAASGSRDKTLRLWHLAGFKEVACIPAEEHTTSVAFAPDGLSVAAVQRDAVFVFDLAREKGKPILTIEKGGVNRVALIGGQPVLAVGAWESSKSFLKLVRLPGGEELRTIEIDSSVEAFAVSPDAKRLVVAGTGDNRPRLSEIESDKEPKRLLGPKDSVQALAWSPDGSLIATGSRDHAVRIHDGATGRLKSTLAGHTYAVACFAFAPDGRWLASGGEDGAIIVWDVATGKALRRLKGDTVRQVRSLAFSPDGRTIVSGGDDMRVKIWRME